MASCRQKREFIVDSFFLYEYIQDSIVYAVEPEEDNLTAVNFRFQSDDRVKIKKEKTERMPLKKQAI